ncbi:MAG: peroxide stress protein YaaA [Rubripirellula sp.]
MIVILSPAKSLDFETAAPCKSPTQPVFASQAAKLMKTLRQCSADDLCDLMHLSEKLGELNFQRNRKWKATHDAKNSKAAVYAFQGDVYQGMDIDQFSAAQVRRCQKHVRILSGLYGILQPLDLIQPYRLEMGTKLATKAGKNLYEFWGDTVADAIAADLRKQKSRLLINLASNEYSKVAKLKDLDADVISPAFREWKNGQFKMISFFAKRARGAMTRYLISNSITTAEGMLDFDLDGYRYDKKLSSESEPVFTRKQSV